MKAMWIRRICHIFLTLALVAAGGCLIWGCLDIYFSGGDQIYTLQKIENTFRTVSVPVYLAVALVIGAFILELVLPVNKQRKSAKNEELILKTLQSRANLDNCGDQALCSRIKALRTQRKVLKVISLVVLALTSAFFFLYALNGHNFHASDFNGSMIRAAIVWGTCLAIPFAFAVFAAYISKVNVTSEIALLKLVALGKKPPRSYKPENKQALFVIRTCVIAAAAGLILVGALGGGWMDVLTKAAAICTECVGLG